MAAILILFGITFPVGWIISEARGYKTARRFFGGMTFAGACLIGWGVGMLSQLNYNAWYGGASKDLLEALAESLPESSKEKIVIREAAEKFKPTYENKANYDDLVKSIIETLPKNSEK